LSQFGGTGDRFLSPVFRWQRQATKGDGLPHLLAPETFRSKGATVIGHNAGDDKVERHLRGLWPTLITSTAKPAEKEDRARIAHPASQACDSFDGQAGIE
jgi:hypothetical protein